MSVRVVNIMKIGELYKGLAEIERKEKEDDLK